MSKHLSPPSKAVAGKTSGDHLTPPSKAVVLARSGSKESPASAAIRVSRSGDHEKPNQREGRKVTVKTFRTNAKASPGRGLII